MTQYIRILNWEKMQHYKDRNPPWIKLHRELLTSETWVSSSNDDRVLAIAIMMLAADTGNLIPANPRYIQRRAYLDTLPDLSGLIALNFIEIIEKNDDASTALASARPETETETETDIPLANANGETPDADKQFWDAAKAYLGPSRASLIGKWVSEYGKPAVIAAISVSQAERAVDPVQFIVGVLRKGGAKQPAIPI
jgi:hypothetical protein